MTGKKLDRQAAFSGTKPIPDHLLLNVPRLTNWLTQNVEGFSGKISVTQFKGGQSNPTYLIEADDKSYVLRRKPPGNLLPAAHAVDREFRIQQTLWREGFPIAKPFAYCADMAVVGTPFYVMEHIQGRIFWEPHIPDIARPDRIAIFDAMNKTIAQLHLFDPANLGISDFGRPENYLARQIKRWSGAYRASETRDIADMERLMAWLPENLPESNRTSIVHGDFRLDNLIIAPNSPDILAVLDWELSTLGDPIADFVYHLMTWLMPRSELGSGTGSLLGLNLAELGIPQLETYAEAYAARTGLKELPNLDVYLAYNFFRLAAILQGIAGRLRDGTATNDNAAMMGTQVEPLARVAWSHAQKAKNL